MYARRPAKETPMTYNGTHTGPLDPFGGTTFNNAQPAPHPGFPHTPRPPDGDAKTLAALSIVFAFVFAPVGAVHELRGLIPPTPKVQTAQQREPLILTIGDRDGIRRFVVIRDVAGEDLESGDMRAPQFRYFGNADAVFFMFDPLRVRGIRDQLHDLLPAQSYSTGDPRTLLSNVLLAIGAGGPKLAVVLSKFDALRALGEVEGSEWSQIMSNAGAAYLRDNSAGRYYDDNDGELLHEEVRSLLLRLHARSIVTAIESRSTGGQLTHRFFVVSALGQPHTGGRLSSRGITPFRCTDPLRWITSSAGVL
jgi:hypothetical protein